MIDVKDMPLNEVVESIFMMVDCDESIYPRVRETYISECNSLMTKVYMEKGKDEANKRQAEAAAILEAIDRRRKKLSLLYALNEKAGT